MLHTLLIQYFTTAVLHNLRITCFPKRDAQHHLRRPGLKAVLYSLRCDGVIVMRSRCFQAAVPRCSDAASRSQLLASLTDSAARDADIMIVTTEKGARF